ncbi:MAG TPA: alpha/beta fold hydrolase [Sedimenticola sp.]|nr:alpha/beta fold hydrolase [Sedimenticola sp.]
MGEQQETVVLVHGIWMTGLEMICLQRRLAAAGFSVRRFHYESLKHTPEENAAGLADFIRRQKAQTLHLVAHSLGGIVVLHLFNRFSSDLPPGRVVLLGAPVRGCELARRMTRIPALNRMLGRSGEQGLLGGAPAWAGGRDLGVIAGTLNMGVGWLFGGVKGPCDGTVAVADTRLPGAADSCVLPVSHMGLLFSRQTADAVGRFLRTGGFHPDSTRKTGAGE